jgi:AraC-like DNA-binding protein
MKFDSNSWQLRFWHAPHLDNLELLYGSKRDYIKSHYAENVSLSELASFADLSRFHLLRLFRNQMGVPPHKYQTQLRITHARKLLRNGHSILKTAFETGFFDQSHFSRNLKRITGGTPGHICQKAISCKTRPDNFCKNE